MVTVPPRRATMALYSSQDDPYSQRVRIVLAEKGVSAEIVYADASAKFIEELAAYNPYGSLPTLVDRDLVLFRSEIIMEYLDERFPHPPLMPVYPVAKGRARLMIYRVNQDWYSLMEKILSRDTASSDVQLARKDLSQSLTSVTPIFLEMPYFISEEFSLIDCCIAPLLWRLPMLGVTLPEQAQPILDYAERIFQRDSFQASLTQTERMMRQ